MACRGHLSRNNLRPSPPNLNPNPRPSPKERARRQKNLKKEIRAPARPRRQIHLLRTPRCRAPPPRPNRSKKNFHRMARKFHPDRHMGHSEWLDLLQDLMARPDHRLQNSPRRAQSAIAYDKQIAAAGRLHSRPGQNRVRKKNSGNECLTRAKQALRRAQFRGPPSYGCESVSKIAPRCRQAPRLCSAAGLAAFPQYRQGRRPPLFHGHRNSIKWNTSTYFQFGELYESDGASPWRAVPHYRRILEIDPQHAKSHRAPSRPSKNENRLRQAQIRQILPLPNAAPKVAHAVSVECGRSCRRFFGLQRGP